MADTARSPHNPPAATTAVQAGTVLHAHRPRAYLIPFGVWSLLIWGIWLLALLGQIAALVNPPEAAQASQVARTPGTLADGVVALAIPLAILAAQLVLSAWLCRRRIEVLADRVVVHGMLRRTEVPVLGVEAVDQLYDMRSISTWLRLHYVGELDTRRISGWLMRPDDMAALGRWILARNREAAAAPVAGAQPA